MKIGLKLRHDMDKCGDEYLDSETIEIEFEIVFIGKQYVGFMFNEEYYIVEKADLAALLAIILM